MLTFEVKVINSFKYLGKLDDYLVTNTTNSKKNDVKIGNKIYIKLSFISVRFDLKGVKNVSTYCKRVRTLLFITYHLNEN